MDALKRNRRGVALALAAIGALSAQFAVAAPKKVPLPKPRPTIHAGAESAKAAAAKIMAHEPR